MQNQDTVFQQVWSVRVHRTPQFLQKFIVVGRSYSRTPRYPVWHDHTFTIVCVRGRPDFGSFSMLNFPSRKRWAQREIVLRSTVSTPQTSISELWNSVGVFPRNVSILMYTRWSSLVTVRETRTAAISTLCLFQAHTPPETNYTALAARSSPVQLLKWRERLCHYLRSVANAGISFEITLVITRVCV